MADIPETDEKPKCPCGSVLVFITDRSESGYDHWQCWSCARPFVTKRPYRPIDLNRRIVPRGIQWRTVDAGGTNG